MQRPSLTDRINQVVEGAEEAVASEEVDPDQIRIPAPKDPEVNPAIYRDVESLLFRGFLVLQAEINGVIFTFKSMNHHEFEYIQWISGSGATMTGRSMERYYSLFISYGVFTINGQNILPERDRWASEVEKVFSGLPVNARSKIIRFLSELNRRASDAITLTEAYQMERASRFKWAQLRGLNLMSPDCTGIEGSDKLGMNFGQLVWRALNHYEDLSETAEREWDNAKFIGSCFAGKEVRKLYNQDKDRRNKEKEERLKRKDQIIRQVVLRERPEQAGQNGRYVMSVARSVEELASQLEKDLRGEKDWHDEVVAREEERIRSQIRERQQKLQELVENREANEGRELSGSTQMLGLSAREVQDRILRQRQLDAQRSASRIVHPELMDEKMSNFMAKYGGSDSTYQNGGEGTIGTTDRDPTDVPPLPPPRPRATPFRR